MPPETGMLWASLRSRRADPVVQQPTGGEEAGEAGPHASTVALV
jgi:hypothetical protein